MISVPPSFLDIADGKSSEHNSSPRNHNHNHNHPIAIDGFLDSTRRLKKKPSNSVDRLDLMNLNLKPIVPARGRP